MITKFNGREVELELDGLLIEMANYTDNGDALSELELEDLQNRVASDIAEYQAGFSAMARYDSYRNK